MAEEPGVRMRKPSFFRRLLWKTAMAAVRTLTLKDPELGRLFGYRTYTGRNIDEHSAMQIAAVWSCVRILAETIGALPWAVYEINGDNAKKVDHDLSSVLLASPNADMTSVEFKEAKITNLALCGAGYSIKDVRSDKSIISLTPVETCRVQKKQKDDGTIFYNINDRGKWVPFPQELIWDVRGFGSSGLTGFSPIGVQRQAMGMSLDAEQFQATFFAQGASPSWIVSVPQWLEEDQREIARENVKNLWGGLGNAHRAQLLEGGMTAVPATMPLVDAQFLELRGFSIEEICRIFRIPPHMVAKLDRSTNNNIEHQGLEFINFTIGPYLKRITSSATKWLFKPEERMRFELRFDTSGFSFMDAVARAAIYGSGSTNGWMSRNEIRAREGMNRVADPAMDSYTVQIALTPIDQLAKLAEAAAKPPEPPKPPVVADPSAPPPKALPGPEIKVAVETSDSRQTQAILDMAAAMGQLGKLVENARESGRFHLAGLASIIESARKDQGEALAPLIKMLETLREEQKESAGPLLEFLEGLRKEMARPTRLVKDAEGNPLGTEKVDKLEV